MHERFSCASGIDGGAAWKEARDCKLHPVRAGRAWAGQGQPDSGRCMKLCPSLSSDRCGAATAAAATLPCPSLLP